MVWQVLRTALSRRETSPVTATITEVTISIGLWYPSVFHQKSILRTSLMVQGLGIHLSIQGGWIRSTVQEDSTCCKPTGSMHHNHQAHTVELACCSYCSPRVPGPMLPKNPSHVWFAAASFFFFFFNHRHSPKRSSKRKFNEQPSEMTSVSNTWNTGNIERIDFRDILEESNWCLVENVCLFWSTPISKGLLVYSGVGRPRSLSYIRIWVPNYD